MGQGTNNGTNGAPVPMALVKRDTAAVEKKSLDRLAFEPSDWTTASAVATALVNSKMLPTGVDTPQKALAIIIQGRELGLSVMQSLRGIHVIEGRPSLSAGLLLGLVMESGKAEFFDLVESTAKKCVYETKRLGGSRSVPMTWTYEDAERAGLTNRPNWRKHPADMLRARCSAALARAVYPDVVFGLCDPDEVADDLPAPGQDVSPVSRDPATNRAEQDDIRTRITSLRSDLERASGSMPAAMFEKVVGCPLATLLGMSVSDMADAREKLAAAGALGTQAKVTAEVVTEAEIVPDKPTQWAPAESETPAQADPAPSAERVEDDDVGDAHASLAEMRKAVQDAGKRNRDEVRVVWRRLVGARKDDTLTPAERTDVVLAMNAIGGAS